MTRRAIAKTAAWAAPAIAFAAASPAYATSGQAGLILLDKKEYEWPSSGELTITGTLVPATGEEVPAGFALRVALIGGSGFTAGTPVVAGRSFSVTLTARPGATETRLQISSTSHPTYAEAQATLTLAGVGLSGTIAFDHDKLEVPSGEKLTITGTLIPDKGTVPADIQLVPVFTDGTGLTVVSGPDVDAAAGTWTMDVRAKADAEEAMLYLISMTHPGYSPAAAHLKVVVLEPGYVDAAYGMIPMSKNWRPTTGSDATVRWFRDSAGTIAVTKAMLGPAYQWLDLRFMGSIRGSIHVENWGATPFGPINYTGGIPNVPSLDVTMESKVVSFTTNGVAQSDTTNAIGTRIGGSSITGPGSLGGRAVPSETRNGFWPTHDSANVFINANNTVRAFLPTGLVKGSAGTIEIVAAVKFPNGSASKLGFIVDYVYK